MRIEWQQCYSVLRKSRVVEDEKAHVIYNDICFFVLLNSIVLRGVAFKGNAMWKSFALDALV